MNRQGAWSGERSRKQAAWERNFISGLRIARRISPRQTAILAKLVGAYL